MITSLYTIGSAPAAGLVPHRLQVWFRPCCVIDRVLGSDHCECFINDNNIAQAINLIKSVPAGNLAKARARMK